MPIAPDSTIEVTYHGRCFGQEIILKTCYVCTVGNGVLSDAAIMNEVVTEVGGGGVNDVVASYLAVMPPQYTLERIVGQEVFPVRKAQYDFTYAPPTPGTHAGAATVACDAAAITRRTALAGKNQRSVLKIGPLPDSVSVAGVLTGAYQALLATLAFNTRKGLLMPVSTCQFLACILNKTTRAHSNRLLIASRIGTSSRVSHRRVVGIGS